ncbi:pyruvate/2-oxoglutarate dehydrogenase complex dihydrolipoamide dehydrogenase (E3) component [Streptomyces sp. LBL]|uniref:hypothetical protein n=1 Tax=Streptomyces sp. LBL TaxID=2940562 RepID=UPI002474FC90|nr:hypothetical protein [Streptomyces sp. LBL]MDH6622251.1 pyruvate/2-oxoglutarate dehydrogenase complex dihydrolipoamide dehydrogenase (E3) component [Streptomyces sp. LBL]
MDVDEQADVVVVGLGPGGEHVAGTVGEAGLDVVGVEPGGEGFVKLVEDADRGVLVGATSAGPADGEVLYGLNVAVHAEVPVDRLRHMIYTGPTSHRAIEAARGALR